MTSTPRRVAVLGGNRIPFARQNTVYASASNQDMLTAALDGLVERYGLQGERLGEFAAGAVLKHSRDFNLAREVVLGSRLSPETPAYDVQQACATGLEAAIAVTNKIKLGQIESAIAGGTDTVSDAPIVVSDRLRAALLDANHAKTTGAKVKALLQIRPKDLAPATPSTSTVERSSSAAPPAASASALSELYAPTPICRPSDSCPGTLPTSSRKARVRSVRRSPSSSAVMALSGARAATSST